MASFVPVVVGWYGFLSLTPSKRLFVYVLLPELSLFSQSLKDDVPSARGSNVDARSRVLNERSKHLDNWLHLLIYAFILFNVCNVL